MTFTAVRLSVALASIHHALAILVIRHYETWRKLGEINVDVLSRAIQILEVILAMIVLLVVIAFPQIHVAHIIIIKMKTTTILIETQTNILLAIKIVILLMKCKMISFCF